ncbi:MAG: DUF2784 domain-containing protein [Pseudomonadota bacterium]
MGSSFLFLLAADTILLLHVLFVVFVLVGLALIFVGNALAWSWVRNPWFRILHLAAIGVVVIQSWFGVICPFTSWEMALRSRAGDFVYSGTFISHWLEAILYYQAPAWVFVVCYTALGAVVITSWFYVRPRSFTKRSSNCET